MVTCKVSQRKEKLEDLSGAQCSDSCLCCFCAMGYLKSLRSDNSRLVCFLVGFLDCLLAGLLAGGLTALLAWLAAGLCKKMVCAPLLHKWFAFHPSFLASSLSSFRPCVLVLPSCFLTSLRPSLRPFLPFLSFPVWPCHFFCFLNFLFCLHLIIHRPGSAACPVFLSYVRSKTCPKSQNEKSEIQNPKFTQKGALHNGPKSKIQDPKSKIQNPRSKIPNRKSKTQDPKYKIQNPAPKSKSSPVGASHDELRNNGPKSKVQNPNPKLRPKSLDFGFWIGNFWFQVLFFWIPDSGLGFGFWNLVVQGRCHGAFSDGGSGSEAGIPPDPP